MYYKQSTKNIQLVILSFDDVMFDLTRLRYNYYRRLCKLYNSPLEKQQFFDQLGSCRSMFANSPIDSALLNAESLISKIEEDLLAYSKMYGLKHRDGLVELMELFRQKNIKCVVTSTHPKKYTEPLYKIAALYHRPTEILYDDPEIPCLPDPSLYQKILNQYHLSSNEVLLIASNRVSVLAANKLYMNVVYLPGLEDVTKEMDIRCLKIVNSLLDVINLILEAGRSELSSEQYLLIRHDGGTQDLYQNYQHLLETHRQDKEILSYIEPIYQEEFSKAQKLDVEKNLQKQTEIQQSSIEDNLSVLDTLESALKDDDKKISEITEALNFKVEKDSDQKKQSEQANPSMEIDEKVKIQKDQTISIKKESNTNPLKDIIDTADTFNLDTLASDTNQDTPLPVDDNLAHIINEISPENNHEPPKEDITRTKAFTKEELRALGIKEKDLLNEDDELIDDDSDNDHQPSLITSFIVNVGYALMDAIIVTLICGVIMVGFYDWLAPTESIFHFIWMIFTSIGNISLTLFGRLLQPIATMFNTSGSFITILSVVISISIIIWLYLDIIAIIKKRKIH